MSREATAGSAAIDRAFSARLERQAILARENPTMLWHVLHEGVLRHMVGSPAIMRAQLDIGSAVSSSVAARTATA
jgi:hypothetical protein